MSTFTTSFLPLDILSIHIRYHFWEVPEPVPCSVGKKAGNKCFVHRHGKKQINSARILPQVGVSQKQALRQGFRGKDNSKMLVQEWKVRQEQKPMQGTVTWTGEAGPAGPSGTCVQKLPMCPAYGQESWITDPLTLIHRPLRATSKDTSSLARPGCLRCKLRAWLLPEKALSLGELLELPGRGHARRALRNGP